MRSALSGKIVIEYPTFIIGPEEFLSKLLYFVKDLSASENSEEELNITRAKRALPDSLSDPNEIDLDVPESSVKHQKISELSDIDDSEEVGQISKDLVASVVSQMVSDEEEDEEEDGSGEEFIKQLELLQSQDITSLQQLIVSIENQS